MESCKLSGFTVWPIESFIEFFFTFELAIKQTGSN